MKRRTADPLSPLLPVARLAAVGLVAAAGSLAAVQAVAGRNQAAAPAAEKLVAIPHYPNRSGLTSTPTTVTDRTRIERAAEIINTLPPAPTGVFHCPNDVGNGLELDFESSDGRVVEVAWMRAGGCARTSISIDGEQQPERAGGLDTIQRIQTVLGTHWQLRPTMPRA